MKYLEKLQEIIENEIGDILYYENREIIVQDDDGLSPEYYRLLIKKDNGDMIGDVTFRCSKDKVEVCISDDCDKWESVEYFDHTVKWFWIALLESEMSFK